MKKCPFVVAKGFIDCIEADCELWEVDTCGLKYIPPKFKGAYQGEYIIEIAQKAVWDILDKKWAEFEAEYGKVKEENKIALENMAKRFDILNCYEMPEGKTKEEVRKIGEKKNDRQRDKGASKEGGKARTGKRQVKGNRS